MNSTYVNYVVNADIINCTENFDINSRENDIHNKPLNNNKKINKLKSAFNLSC